MAIVEFKNFSFSYTEQENVLSNINLEVQPGEFVLLCGPSGSGKTTLLTNIKKEIRPNGIRGGDVFFMGTNIKDLDDKRSACEIGFLFQNPDDQIVSDTVLQEIAFPLENIGLPTGEIRNRIAEMAAFFGLDKYLHKNVNELSGGQKQLVNLCSLLVLKPHLLLLDEPTSQLDPISAYDFLSILRRLNEEFSITIMATEHKIDNIFPFVDKAIFLDKGIVKYVDKPRTVCSQVWKNSIFQNYLPAVTKIHFMLRSKYPDLESVETPLNIREGRRELNFLEEKLESTNKTRLHNFESPEIENSHPNKKKSSEVLIKCENIWFGYVKENIVLKGVFMDINRGEFLNIVGGNGVGKTTLLQIIAGILKPKKGKVNYKKCLKLGYVHQNPIIHFMHETVREELFGLPQNPSGDILTLGKQGKIDLNHPSGFKKFFGHFSESDIKPNTHTVNCFISEKEVDEFVKFFGISKLLDKHPYDCSGGEQQKIVIVKELLKKPDVLILDEPTKGLDPVSKIHLADKLKKLQENGLTIIMTTHDIAFAAEYCERCIMLFDGNIQVDNVPKAVFSSNTFYTTFVNRMVKDFLPDSITLKDVKEKWII
ncbi:MAG: ATP-binding cassette domain-containing protein [Methanobacterium paludis]|nr:ATP-binding cassette domain-containing protein [Methanobacterium paludis]